LINCREGISLQGADSFAFWKNTEPFLISHSECSCIQATDYEEHKMEKAMVYLVAG
jgi:hypothetical protein